jgi:4'-phosphopantetheinyl transferase
MRPDVPTPSVSPQGGSTGTQPLRELPSLEGEAWHPPHGTAARGPLARIWRIDLNAAPGVDAWAVLSADERARHDRLVFPGDRARFAAAHVAVRTLIGAAAGVAPAAVAFAHGPHGKPHLTAPASIRSAGFNLSHGHDIGVLLWAPGGGDWGVDVERLRPIDDAEAIAQRVFTENEFTDWAATPPVDRDRRFLVLWTRKEACLKAIGSGFAVEPQRFEAGLAPLPRDVVLPTPDGGRARVRVADLDVGPDAVAAVARVIAPIP